MTWSSPTSRSAIEHVLVSLPPTMAAQAPHCPRPQPNLGPFNPRSFRSTYSSGVSGAASTTCGSPFTVIRGDTPNPQIGDDPPDARERPLGPLQLPGGIRPMLRHDVRAWR